jgi:membrane protein
MKPGGRMQKYLDPWRKRGQDLYGRTNQRLGGIPEILRDALVQFNKARGAEAAASMAYFSIFSLFPLLLSIIAISSLFLESQRIQLQVQELVRLVFPVAPGLIVDNINEVLNERTAFGLTGAVGLVWAATAVFTTLFRNINRAWLRAEPLNVLKARLVGVLFIITLVVVLFLVRIGSALFNLVPELAYLFGENGLLNGGPLYALLSFFVPMTITFLIFLAIYRWVPNAHVLWSEAFWGALLAALGWEISTNIFTWLLTAGMANYQVVYGSLGGIIALLFWIYLNSMIVIFSAHLSAAIARKNRPYSEDTQQKEPLTEWA